MIVSGGSNQEKKSGKRNVHLYCSLEKMNTQSI